MPGRGFDAPDLLKFIEHAFPGVPREELIGQLAGGLGAAWRRPEPQLLPVPDRVRGFRLRVDLQHTKPPVWRRIEVSGDLTLPRLHAVLQATMGWTDSHLHRFRTGNDRMAPEFITPFDLEEGEEGMLEDEVRLDQLVAESGDRLWYDYDFGDGWKHVLRVEQVLDMPPEVPRCLTGKLACPPEDCGGVWGYGELADWVRSDYDGALRPEVFDSDEHARDWLPSDWHPDRFDVDETNERIAAAVAEPAPVGEELASLLEAAERRGASILRDILGRPASHGPVAVDDAEAAALTEPFRVLLDVIGGGANLTAAGYLRPDDVEEIARRTGITEWWIGKANREDLTPPVATLRSAARALGLVAVRNGRISPTRAAARCAGDPQALLHHIVGRLPLGKSPAERQAGWAALVVAGSDADLELWNHLIVGVLFDLGWRDGHDRRSMPPADSPTLDVMEQLAGVSRGRRLGGIHRPVGAIARAAVRG
ncbi:plasmid pRiA4b ORF-3 family protein [Agromyces archimandritae]|uniref:Plasmid pRiA4b ORF-3 family protein n=2 Tax=Agromyces archimandritae TaxID=2781962 RepID=A0A975IQ66_9MICO|nr:plasmid pRiA4b ORF-3 family protein [Agromyces archimandritae]